MHVFRRGLYFIAPEKGFTALLLKREQQSPFQEQ